MPPKGAKKGNKKSGKAKVGPPSAVPDSPDTSRSSVFEGVDVSEGATPLQTPPKTPLPLDDESKELTETASVSQASPQATEQDLPPPLPPKSPQSATVITTIVPPSPVSHPSTTPIATTPKPLDAGEPLLSSPAQAQSPVLDPPTPAQEQEQQQTPKTIHTSDQLPAESLLLSSGLDAEHMSPDIVAIAGVFSGMKNTLTSMTSLFDRLGGQAEKLQALSVDIKATEHLKRLRDQLEEQINRQKAELAQVRSELEDKIKASVQAQIKSRLQEAIKQTVAKTIEERVQIELAQRIPEGLHDQVVAHQRQILELRTDLHNSEARRYNASLLSAQPTAPLRPLLRPLPTPEQSPMPITRSSSGCSSIMTPLSVFPHGPTPTPIKRTTSRDLAIPPTPSLLFPRDLKSLFSLKPEAAKKLLREYGLASGNSTPLLEKPKVPLPHVVEETATSPGGWDLDIEDPSDMDEVDEENAAEHVEGMNKFMAHIGVPFLMIPPPKPREPQVPPTPVPPPMSAATRRRTLLAPLIITTSPRLY